MMPDPASLAALRAMVEQWRADSVDFDTSWTKDTRATLRQCAYELAAVLAVVPRPLEIPFEAIRSALGLAASERNKWEGHDPRTFQHWERVCVVLNGFLLAEEVSRDLVAVVPRPQDEP